MTFPANAFAGWNPKSNQYHIMALSAGTPAPDFKLSTMGPEGPQLVSLKDTLAKGPVVLLFHPMVFTGPCADELCSVTNDLDAYNGLGATVLVINGDNPFAQAEWKEKEGIKLTMLSDYEHEVTKAYDVAYDTFLPDQNLPMGGVPKRSAFVINKAGEIVYVESSDDPSVFPDFDAIKATVKEL